MTLVCVWGHSALGKSTWLESIRDELPSLQSNLAVVLCDYPREYHYRPGTNDWLLITVQHRRRWKGVKIEKLQWPIAHIIIDAKVWVIESSRYFNGMQKYMVEAFQANGCRGLSVIVPWAQPEVHREFIRQRCLSKNKPMSQWWESLENCEHEANNRLNSIPKWFEPVNIPARAFEIDAERRGWACVTEYLKEQLRGTVTTNKNHKCAR